MLITNETLYSVPIDIALQLFIGPDFFDLTADEIRGSFDQDYHFEFKQLTLLQNYLAVQLFHLFTMGLEKTILMVFNQETQILEYVVNEGVEDQFVPFFGQLSTFKIEVLLGEGTSKAKLRISKQYGQATPRE